MKSGKQIQRQAKRLFRLCLEYGLLNEDRARQVAQQLGQARHSSRLAILSHFQRLVRLDRARHSARVESAVPLRQDFEVDIQAKLLHVYGPGLSTSFSLRESLIGGMRIQVGCDVYDDSVQARLAAMEARL